MSTFPGYAQGEGIPLGFQQLSGTGVLTLTVPAGATFAVISVDTNDVRYRDDGTPPTALIGILIPKTASPGEPFVYSSPTGLKALQLIPVTGTAVLNVAYYR